MLDDADTVHKPGFKIQARILHHLFSIVSSGAIKAPLWDLSKQDASAYPNNVLWAREQITRLLTESFPNLRPHQVEVSGSFPSTNISWRTEHDVPALRPATGYKADPCDRL